MAFCKNCGNQIEDNAATCPNCGASQNTTPQVTDNGGFLWGLLGCCIPIVGLVLFLVWKDTKPKLPKLPESEHWSVSSLEFCGTFWSL